MNNLQVGLLFTFIALTWFDVGLTAYYAHRNPTLVCLIDWIYLTITTIYYIQLLIFGNLPVWARCFVGMMAVVSAWFAAEFYDRWNNRRRRRKGRVAGKVGIRLGRLVIIPEA